MERRLARSTDVTDTLAMPLETAEGPAPAFEALYRSSRDDVYAYVATLLRDRAVAEDVTAATFERAYRKRRSFNPRRGTARAWLFGIARNAALDELRRRNRQVELAVEPEAPGEQVVEEVEHALRRTVVRAALAELEPRERELVALKFHGGLTNGEIARVLGTSETNAGTQLHRAVTKLRKACHATA